MLCTTKSAAMVEERLAANVATGSRHVEMTPHIRSQTRQPDAVREAIVFILKLLLAISYIIKIGHILSSFTRKGRQPRHTLTGLLDGSLALGAGQGMVHGAPLDEVGGQVIPLKKALESAAESLAQGQPIPAAAQKFIAKPFIPAWLYRLLGGVGSKQQAKRWGAQNDLWRETYSTPQNERR